MSKLINLCCNRNNLQCLHLDLRSALTWEYGRARAGAPGSNLRESRSTGGVNQAVSNPVPAMLLPSSHPHHDFCINGLRARIKVRPIHLRCHRVVLTEVTVDSRVAVRFWGVRRVVVDIRCRLPFVGQSPRLDRGARLASM